MKIEIEKDVLKNLLALIDLQDIYITDDYEYEMKTESPDIVKSGEDAYSKISDLVNNDD